jgi:hypothetical protein
VGEGGGLDGRRGLAELEQGAAGPLVIAMEPRFIARDEGQGAGVVGQRADGFAEMDGVIGAVEIPLDIELVAQHFAVDDDVFGGNITAEAPAGDDNLLDEVGFSGVDGLVNGDEFGHHFVEILGAFAFKKHGVARGEAVAECIAGGFLASLGGLGTSGFGSVGSGRVGLELAGHGVFLGFSLHQELWLARGPLLQLLGIMGIIFMI